MRAQTISMNRLFKVIIFLFCFIGFYNVADASHSIGGEMRCDNLGQGKYRVTIILYQDCINGEPEVIAQDNPAIVSVFEKGSNTLVAYSGMQAITTDILPASQAPACLQLQHNTCVRRQYFVFGFNLQETGEYTFSYQRCCLSAAITNISNSSSQGTTLFVNSTGVVNNSAYPKILMPSYTCTNENFGIDVSANEPDGDVLKYRLLNVYNGGDSKNAKPNQATPPPYTPLQYSGTSSWQQPLTGFGELYIDPSTGMLQGICKQAGKYMIGIACDEYRNGQLINTSVLNYVYAFVDCKKFVKAGIKRDELVPKIVGDVKLLKVQCGQGNTVQFTNQSEGATSYVWDFGDTSTVQDTSSAVNPAYTYPQPGRYTVKLTAFGPECINKIEGDVLILPDTLTTDFSAQGGPCIFDSIHVSDLTNATGSPVTKSVWVAGQNVFYGDVSTVYFSESGQQKLQHIIMTQNGCIASAEQTYQVKRINVQACNDTIVKAGTFLSLSATGATSYHWQNLGNVSNSIINVNTATPLVSCKETGKGFLYAVMGSDADGCRGTDTVAVTITEKGYVIVPTAFTPNGDGQNDVLRVHMSDMEFVEFSVFNRRGNQVFISNDLQIGWDGKYKGSPEPNEVYYWMVKARDANSEMKIYKGNTTLLR